MSYPASSAPEDVVLPLNTIAGSGDPHIQVASSNRQRAASCSNDRFHRKLAIGSIICGISCIGIKALIDSVKAETATDPELASKFSHRARKFGMISIGVWVLILIMIPILMALFSYLATLKN